MKHLNLILMSHILSTSANEAISVETEYYCPVCYNASPLSQRKHYETLLFTSMINPSVLFTIVFSSDNFNILCLWPNWFCVKRCRVSFTPVPWRKKQLFALNKIFRCTWNIRLCRLQLKIIISNGAKLPEPYAVPDLEWVSNMTKQPAIVWSKICI